MHPEKYQGVETKILFVIVTLFKKGKCFMRWKSYCLLIPAFLFSVILLNNFSAVSVRADEEGGQYGQEMNELNKRQKDEMKELKDRHKEERKAFMAEWKDVRGKKRGSGDSDDGSSAGKKKGSSDDDGSGKGSGKGSDGGSGYKKKKDKISDDDS